MIHQHYRTTLLSQSDSQNSTLLFIGLFVVSLHFILLGIGTIWNSSIPEPKQRSRVIVQTVNLSPTSPLIQTASLPHPVENPKVIAEVEREINAKVIEEIQTKEEPSIQKNENEKKDVSFSQVEEPLPEVIPVFDTTPPSVKQDILPKPKTPEKTQSKEKKAPIPAKKPAPTLKKGQGNSSTAKSSKTEKTKSKEGEVSEKKRQQEKVEAEKKRQIEQESERKKQQEKVEAEKKRQQEIAAAQEVARQKEMALLNKAKQNLAKIGESRNKISSSSSTLNLSTTQLPTEIGTLQVDALPLGEFGTEGGWGSNEMSYSDEVASRLKAALKFPDYGAVKIKLTLNRNGKVIKVETLKSESNKNKVYVESKVPSLLFPSFGQRFQGVSENTFVITLQNDS